jgi:hypothetical protein
MVGHKNSEGLDAPWVIKSHETGEILSSHKSKKDAEKHLYKDMQGHKKSSLEPVLDDVKKQIIVFFRMQHDLDKNQLIDSAVKKYNISLEDGEICFAEAYPSGLSFVEKPAEKTCDCTSDETCNCTDKKRIHSNIEKVIANIKDFDITDEFIEDLYKVVSSKQNIDSIVDKYKIKNDAFVLVLYSLLEELHDIISKK